MAAEQSTTEQLDSVKSPTRRRLTVGYLASSAKGHPPHIRLMGRWVEDAGFPIGAEVDVEVSHVRLVIELAPLSTLTVARRGDFTYSTIEAFQRGKRQPKLAAFIALAWALHEEPRDLFDKLLTAMHLPPGRRPVLNRG
jgi:hypothetical protein